MATELNLIAIRARIVRRGLILLTLCVSGLLPAALHAQALRVGFFDLSPHVRRADASHPQAGGPAIDYLQKIAESMGVDLIMAATPVPLNRLLHDLSNGTLDVAVALGKSPERERDYQFPAQPFYRMRPAVMVVGASPLQSIATPKQLEGIAIGIYSAGYLSPMMSNPKLNTISLFGESIISRAYAMMLSHRLDAMYSPDELDLRSQARQNGFAEQVRVLVLPEPATGLYTVFSKSVPAAVVRKYEASLEKMKPYGSYLDVALTPH